MVGVAYAIFAIPSGLVAHKYGRKKTIRTSLVGLIIVLVLIFAHSVIFTTEGVSQTLRMFLFWALMFVFGIFWVSVITNSFPCCGNGRLCNMESTLGSTILLTARLDCSSSITGGLIDLFGYGALFRFAAAAC